MLKMNIEVGAQFKFVTSKQNGKISNETDWISNLVLDAGLDAMGGQGTADISHIWIGSGNSTPVPSQVSLDNRFAGTSTIQGADQNGIQSAELPYFYFCRRTFRFGLGVAAGNISEVGLGDSGGTLFNRALIKDALGNPTTLTILPDEILDVVVELRVYPKTDFAGEFNLLNKLGDVVSTHTYTGNAVLHPSGISWSIRDVGVNFPLLGMKVGGNTVSPGNVSYPSTSGFLTKNMSQSRPNLRSIKGSINLGLNDGNSWQHKGFLVPVGNLLSKTDSSALIGYKWDVTPPIPKNNQQSLRYSFEIGWDRYIA